MMAWEVSSDGSDSLRQQQIMAVTLPRTLILSLNQSTPSWLQHLLLLCSQNPALSSGWLQTLPTISSYCALQHRGCSTLLVALSQSDEPQQLFLNLPQYRAQAWLLFSTWSGRSKGKVSLVTLVLAPQAALILRLIPRG
ncbi:uncharacterized protein WCC33_015835 [Rhinophrynus dorsalis]